MTKLHSRKYAIIAALLGALVPFGFAQQNKPIVSQMAQSKFETMAGLPRCATFSVQKGDPAKEGAVILFKMPAGCLVPRHWHSINENAMIVSGKGKLEMQGERPQTVTTGDYIFFPAHHNHQFVSLTPMIFFGVTDGPFDMHYVDANGKEITAEQALKITVK